MAQPFNYEQFPTLETARLLLREITIDDADAVFQLRSDPAVTRYNTGSPLTNRAEASTLIAVIASAYFRHVSVRWGITLKPDPTLIGICGYNIWLRAEQRASIGYDLRQGWWGRGIMTEALTAMIAFGFTRMDLQRIEADVHRDNAGSQRVLAKLGFQVVSDEADPVALPYIRDYALTRNKWEGQWSIS